MKKSTLFFFMLVIFVISSSAGEYQMIRIQLNSAEDLEKIARAGVDFEGSRYKQNEFIDLQVSSFEKDLLEDAGFSTQILIQDLEEYYASRLEQRIGEGFGYGSMGGYYTFSEAMANLDSLIATYPNLVSQKDTIGYSVLGKPLIAVKISDNPNVQENEPEVLFTGLHHAREPMSMMVLLYYMWFLTDNYGSDSRATFLVNNRQLWFVPVVNPDGYVRNQQTNPSGGGMWRLNARDNNDNGSNFQSGIDGVDLNRNYGYQWGYDNSGSSPIPGSQTYRGPYRFSEVETSFIRDFCNQHNFVTAFNYHSYSNLLIHPWAYNDSPTPDHRYFHAFGTDMTRYNGYILGTPSQTVGYSVNGDANDWMYGEQNIKNKIFSFTPEVGTSSDDFWPPTSRILPLAEENLYPNIVLSFIAGSYAKIYENSVVAYGQNRYADPGEMVTVFPGVTNYGVQASGPVQMELTPRQPVLIPLQNSVQFPAMQTFDSLTSSTPWKFQVPYSTVPGTQLSFDINIFENGSFVYSDSLILTVGTFDLAFADSGNTALAGWTIGGSGGSWGMSSTSHSPLYSFTDSPAGNYANSCDFWLRSQTINLTDATSARLQFWTKWDIEAGWDFGLLEISTNNGISWSPLVGQYMKPASGSGVQSPGLLGYDGTQNEWIQESIDLQAYCGQNVMIRFRLKSDYGVTGDGWYVDDISVEKMGQNTNIPPYISSLTDLGYQSYTGQPFPVSAIVLDDHGVEEVSLFYSVDGASTFQQVGMTGSDSLFETAIPALVPGQTVEYYVQARDSNGAAAYYPYDFPDQMMNLIITGNGPFIAVEPASLSFSLPQSSTGIQNIKISNPGTDPVSFEILDSTVTSVELLKFSSKQRIRRDAAYIGKIFKKRLRNRLAGTEFSTPPQENSQPPVRELSPAIVISDPAGDTDLPGIDIVSVDISESTFNYTVSLTLSAMPDTGSLAAISVDLDQNFGTGAFPAPFGYGLGNFDVGAEYEIYFDFANLIGDSLGLSPSGYVVNVRDSSITPVGLPVSIQYNGNTASLTLLKLLYPVFDGAMNLSAMTVRLDGMSLPDVAPDLGHGNTGGELGCSWVTEFDSTGQSYYPMTGTIDAGDSVIISVKAASVFPQGNYQAKLVINNSGPVTPLEVPIDMMVTAPGNPVIAVAPSPIIDTLEAGTGIHSIPLTISNIGNATLYFVLSDTVFTGSNWLNTSPQLGVIPAGEFMEISVEIDQSAIQDPGQYDGEILISSNDPSQPESRVPVTILIQQASSIVTADPVPQQLALYANFPNPFNPSTRIAFDLPRNMNARLEIFNLLGQKVATLVDGRLTAGHYEFEWNISGGGKGNFSSGLYFYRLDTAEGVLVRKMLLTK